MPPGGRFQPTTDVTGHLLEGVDELGGDRHLCEKSLGLKPGIISVIWAFSVCCVVCVLVCALYG